MVAIIVFVGNTVEKINLIKYLARSHHIVNLEVIALFLHTPSQKSFVLVYRVSRKNYLKKTI